MIPPRPNVLVVKVERVAGRDEFGEPLNDTVDASLSARLSRKREKSSLRSLRPLLPDPVASFIPVPSTRKVSDLPTCNRRAM